MEKKGPRGVPAYEGFRYLDRNTDKEFDIVGVHSRQEGGMARVQFTDGYYGEYELTERGRFLDRRKEPIEEVDIIPPGGFNFDDSQPAYLVVETTDGTPPSKETVSTLGEHN